MFSKFFPENCALYEIMCKKYGRAGQATDGNIIRRMGFASWITKAADTHSEYVKRLLFYSNSDCTKAPQCRIIHACLFLSAHRYFEM